MRESVYVETSVVSYLTARASKDPQVAVLQSMTEAWWRRRGQFDVFTSPIVFREAARGDSELASRRLDALKTLMVLELTLDVATVAERLIKAGALPRKAEDDAFHVATAAVNGMDYLLTWNCKHIDNAQLKPLMRKVCIDSGFKCPEICTPRELMGNA
jgi:predicted nucleic acid-binding protein